MQKLTQLAEGEYFLENMTVISVLVYGPILYTYKYDKDYKKEIPIEDLIAKIHSQTNIDLNKISNSYHSGGISIHEQNGEKTRHEIIMFFMSKPKPIN